MNIAAQVNGEIRRRFEQFGHYGAPGRYINLPHGFRAEADTSGDVVLVHNDCPDYPIPIGTMEFDPHRWVLGLGWDRAAAILVRMLGLNEQIDEEVPF